MRIVAASLLGLVTMMAVVIVATVVASAALAGPDGGVTAPYLAANLVASFAGAGLGGWVAMHISRGRWSAVTAVAVVMTILSAGSAFQPAPGQPAFYPVTVYALGLAGLEGC